MFENIKNHLSNKTSMAIVIFIAGLFFIFIGVILSISYGARDISFSDTIFYLFDNTDTSSLNWQIVNDIRLPRALSAVLIGAILATSGAIIQGITRNPIASPSIMGITQGSALGVALYMAYQPGYGTLGRILFAFAGASISSILVFFLSLRKLNVDVTRIILAGTALGMLFISLASVIALLTNNTRNLMFWIAGGLSSATWDSVYLLFGISLVFLLISFIISHKVTILSLGDEVAIGLGESPNKIRIISLVVVVVLSGTATAIGGNIGFVCLIVPHIAKSFVSTDYRLIIPVSMVFGGALLVYSDILARVLASPFEIPLGAITSLIGVPTLIYLVRRGYGHA